MVGLGGGAEPEHKKRCYEHILPYYQV